MTKTSARIPSLAYSSRSACSMYCKVSRKSSRARFRLLLMSGHSQRVCLSQICVILSAKLGRNSRAYNTTARMKNRWRVRELRLRESLKAEFCAIWVYVFFLSVSLFSSKGKKLFLDEGSALLTPELFAGDLYTLVYTTREIEFARGECYY